MGGAGALTAAPTVQMATANSGVIRQVTGRGGRVRSVVILSYSSECHYLEDL